ncbi:MAG TPA: hypothetical protein VLL48_14980, partial [Longimicrobiales bacterium]|nr:hypothetical protein [Longimicrobiales bacterium]
MRGRSGSAAATGSPGSTAALVRRSPAIVLLTLVGAFPGQAGWLAAQELVIRGGEVRPVSGPAVPGGVVIVRDGRIVDVGPEDVVGVPMGVEEIDATGRIVTPGFLDARTGLGVGSEGALDRSTLVRHGVRVADHLEAPEVPGVFGMEGSGGAAHPWLADGVTTVYAAPSPGNLVGAFGAVVKLDDDGFGVVVDSAAALHVSLVEDPLVLFDAPTTRQGMVAVLRQWLVGARARMEGRTARPALAGEDTPVPPPDVPGPDLEAVLR